MVDIDFEIEGAFNHTQHDIFGMLTSNKRKSFNAVESHKLKLIATRKVKTRLDSKPKSCSQKI